MSSKTIYLFSTIICVVLITSNATSFLVNESSDKKSIPDPRFPRLSKSILNGSEIFDNDFSYQYYFDDGKIASEVMSLKNITTANVEYNQDDDETYANQTKTVTVAVGQGFFRFLIKQNIYSFKYDASESGIQGELSYTTQNGTIITEHLRSSFNEFSLYPPNTLKESEQFRVSYRRISYLDGDSYIVDFMFSNNLERKSFQCTFETNTRPQYYFICDDPNETISHEWLKQLNVHDENGHYTFNYTSNDREIFETGTISDKINISSGLVVIPNKNGLIRIKYTSDSSDNNATMLYPFNNGTEVTYYYPISFMPDEEHVYVSVTGHRELIRLHEKSVVKSSVVVRFTGPNGSGDEHITWIHEFDIYGQNLEYHLSGVAPVAAKLLASLVG